MKRGVKERRKSVHFRELRGVAAGDFLYAKLPEFRLEVDELFFEIIFALAPELAGFDLGGRLSFFYQHSSYCRLSCGVLYHRACR